MATTNQLKAAVLASLLIAATTGHASEKAEKHTTDTGAIASSPITLAMAAEFAQNYTDGRAVHAELKRDRGYYAVDVEAAGAGREVRISAIDGRILSDQRADD